MNLVLIELQDEKSKVLADFGSDPDWNEAYQERNCLQMSSIERWPHLRYVLRWRKANAKAKAA